MITAPDPPLTDGVVTLRPWDERDVPALVECIDGDDEITRWMDAIPQPYRDAEVKLIQELTGRQKPLESR